MHCKRHSGVGHMIRTYPELERSIRKTQPVGNDSEGSYINGEISSQNNGKSLENVDIHPNMDFF